MSVFVDYAKLHEIKRRCDESVEQGVGELADAVAARARALAPVRTGIMRSSIRVFHRGTYAAVTVGTSYAQYQERGAYEASPTHAPVKAQYFMRGAVASEAPSTPHRLTRRMP